MAAEMDAAAATCPVSVQGADNIRVVLRLRPVTEDEKKEERSTKLIVGARALTDGKSIVVYSPKEESYKEYHFDHVFDAVTSQRAVYEIAASHLVHGLISGKNACLIAYGQTGTGKTFTMFGNRRSENFQHESHEGTEGVVHHLIKDLFDIIPTQEIQDGEEIGPSPSRASCSLNSHGIVCSFVEIYQDQIRDLLTAADESNSSLPKPKLKSTLTLRESFGKGAGGVFVVGAHWQNCHTKEDVMNLLERGNKSRTTSDTGMNADSSRSHAIFTIKYQGPRAKEGNARFLHVVDLAGSELAKKTNAVGQTMEESKKINKSLSALGNVVKAVTERRSHVPYRDSKLTRLLQDAIGGSALTTIILTASPSVRDTSETTSTIRFGKRAKNIKKPQARWNPTDNEEITDEIIAEENNWHAVRNDLFSASPGKYSEMDWEDDRDVSMIALNSSSLDEDEIVGATIIVPSAPTPPADSHHESSSLAGSSSGSSELSLKPSMLDSSILMTDSNFGEAGATSPVASDVVLASREENEGMRFVVDTKDSERYQLQGTEEHVSGSCVRSRTVATLNKQTPKDDSTVASHCGDGSELDIDVQATDSRLSSDNFLKVGRRLFVSSQSDEVEREEEEKRLGSPDRKHQRDRESPQSPSSCMDVQSETEASKKTSPFFMPPLMCFAILGFLVIMPFFVYMTGYSKHALNNLYSSVNLKQSSVQILAFGNEREAPSNENGKPVEIYDDLHKISVESQSGDEGEQLFVTTTNQSLSVPDYKKIRVLGEELSHHKMISSEANKKRTASNARRFSVSKDEDSELHGSTADPFQFSLKLPFCSELQATSGLPEVTEKFLGEGCCVTTFSQTTHNWIGPSSDEIIRKCSSCFPREDDYYLIPEPLQVGKWDDVEDVCATTDKTARNGDQSKLADLLRLLRFWELAVVCFVCFTGSILRSRRRKMKALPERMPQTPMVLCCCTERLSSLKKQTLTNMCRDRSLKVSGTKSTLVERLLEAEGEYHDNLSYQTPKQHLYHESPKVSRGVSAQRSDHQQMDDLQKLTRSELRGKLRSMGLQISGNKPDLIHRLQMGERLRNLKVSALKELLREKGLKTSGKKSELFDRLMKAV